MKCCMNLGSIMCYEMLHESGQHYEMLHESGQHYEMLHESGQHYEMLHEMRQNFCYMCNRYLGSQSTL